MAKAMFNSSTPVRVKIHEDGIAAFLQANKSVRDLLVQTAQAVQSNAEMTAQSAQKGPGGTIDGYAEAGFDVVWESRGGKRPRVLIRSLADKETAMAAHFYTQKRDGVAHLRAALYRETNRG